MPGSSWVLRASFSVLLGLVILSSACHVALLLLTMSVTIGSSGQLIYPPGLGPLHVEGRYIKDSLGNIVILRGVFKPGFEDYPTGVWMGKPKWNSSAAEIELDAMKSWGCNVMRMHDAVEQWKYDMENHRQIIKELIALTSKKGLYLIYEFYSLRNYFDGGVHDSLPYPPYQKSPNASDVIANEDEFVDLWANIANELKGYPNVIFELWNEPGGGVRNLNITEEKIAQAKLSWFNVSQSCINAIRSVGASQLIVIQWDYGVWINLDYGGGSFMDWITEANLTDPLGNLVYSTHIYRTAGGFGFWTASHGAPPKVNAWNYSDILDAFQREKIDWVGDTLNKPLLIGEIGCNLAYEGEELEREKTSFRNALTVFNEWELGYVGFWWRNTGIRRLLKYGEPWVPPPSESGEIFIELLNAGKE